MLYSVYVGILGSCSVVAICIYSLYEYAVCCI